MFLFCCVSHFPLTFTKQFHTHLTHKDTGGKKSEFVVTKTLTVTAAESVKINQIKFTITKYI